MIDVIVPVRGAGPAFLRCAASLSRHVAPGSHRLIVVLDGPGDADAFAALDQLRRSGLDPIVLEHPAPLGFPASVNRGMALSERDVVLLNSDTQVTAGWLEKLADAAASGPDVATVTPFSNNATIASLPVFLAENTIPDGYGVDGFAALVEARSARLRPALPTGVGVCLYIRRAALSAVGPFSEAYGLGYGEEVDFCLRTSAAGFRHLLDDATFIFHEGHRSFGARRAARIRRAERRLRSRFPHYDSLINGFIDADPVAPARARVVDALRPWRPPASTAPRQPPRRVVHVVHGWPPWAHGGTEHYAAWLARAQAAAGDEVVVYARITDADRRLGDAIEHVDGAGVRVRLIVNNFTQRDPLCRNGFHCGPIARDFGRLLDQVRPDLVHVHHLAGHCASLLGVAARRGAPIVYQAQDWWPACARVNLIDRDGALCPGPQPLRCARCLPMTSRPPATLASAALYAARGPWIRRQLSHVAAVIAGSRFIADSYARWRILPDTTPVHVVPYGVPALPRQPRGAGPLGRPVRFGVVGALRRHKGVHVAVEAFAALATVEAELHVWGSSDDTAYQDALDGRAAGLPGVHVHGPFDEAERAELLRGLDVLIVPSIGWESFGLAAREAWQQGVPVIASRRSALIELFPDGEERGGALVEADDVADLARAMARVVADPGVLDRWRASIPAVRTTEEHAAAIEAIYGGLIRQSR
jgi:glycosyltransferase involved in cell wall biosynthesis/GT2 family glycosyltransferase